MSHSNFSLQAEQKTVICTLRKGSADLGRVSRCFQCPVAVLSSLCSWWLQSVAVKAGQRCKPWDRDFLWAFADVWRGLRVLDASCNCTKLKASKNMLKHVLWQQLIYVRWALGISTASSSPRYRLRVLHLHLHHSDASSSQDSYNLSTFERLSSECACSHRAFLAGRCFGCVRCEKTTSCWSCFVVGLSLTRGDVDNGQWALAQL